LGYLVASYYPAQRRWFAGGVLGILFFIGFSRADWGLNWPSDLLAGYSLGALWFIFCLTLLRIQWMRQTNGRGQAR
jgi:membrane-associated phospholipid phosphatase